MKKNGLSKWLSALVMLVVAGVVWTGSTETNGAQSDTKSTAVATFAGGCFWCMEPPYDKLTGVISTTSGYIGGHQDKPTYKQVSAGVTGHTEAMQVVYDPSQITYQKLLQVFWRNVDPTTADRQFCDHGTQYRTGIFTYDDEQKRLADSSKAELESNKPFAAPIVTEIVPATTFYPAEDYHQDYYKKSPLRYKLYRFGCGRDKRIRDLWGEDAHKGIAKH